MTTKRSRADADRRHLIGVIYRACPKDYRLTSLTGQHKIMVLENGVTTLVTLENLSTPKLESMHRRYV